MEIPNICAVSLVRVTDQTIRAHLSECRDMEKLKTHLAREIREEVLRQMAERRNLYVIPSPFLSLFFDGCLENGRDISEGCVYNNWGLHGTGLAPATDMLAAADRKVFGGNVSAEELISAMDRNFEGAEKLRETLRHDCLKMGNDDGAASYAAWILHTFAESVKDLRNERGDHGVGTLGYHSGREKQSPSDECVQPYRAGHDRGMDSQRPGRPAAGCIGIPGGDPGAGA